ncbi:hypothetical protein [Microbacterium sp. BLY]|uniref:hypothetical protein n=1 Tax=Microbacterium sp. BLY TaxID=2823280 RepID=UPI001B33F4E5|nr:hypothetical protein [Microbacterium sp. BLY]MBP3978634.1 hypothetical protein [Microbacterium sp. BLY]
MSDTALLERVLVEADPARTPRDAQPDPRAAAVRDRIVTLTRAPQRRRRRARMTGWGAGLTAVAASAAVAFGVLVPPGAAVAGTPSPLVFEEAGSLSDTVAAAEADLEVFTPPAEPERTSRTAFWSYNVEVDTAQAEIVPQFATFTWNADLSGEAVAIDGEPYDPTDAVANGEAEVRSTGEVASHVVLAPGEFDAPVVEAPGDAGADVRALLVAFDMPEDPTAFEVVTAITSVFGQWTLTNAQHAELLALLEDAGGAEALGMSTDRLGRPVAGIRVISADGVVRDDLLVSRDTGRIVGLERTVLKDDGVFPAGAVVDYRMWEVDEEARP